MRSFLAPLAVAITLAAPLAAKQSLGVFGSWGAFRDEGQSRCYAIAMPRSANRSTGEAPFASVATWPRRNIRSQVYIRLSRDAREGSSISLQVGSERFALTGNGNNAWAQDRSMDAAIVAALRSSDRMTVRATDPRGVRFAERYSLDGVATALDAATVACSRRR